MDLVLAVIGLVLTLPFYPLIAAAILVDAGRPVFYLQERVGQGGRLFKVIKFRTMVRDAERDTGPVLATANDQRITRVGRVLRAFRLDELPQFINILLGDMSFVGPRPERPMFVERFIREIPLYAYRHVVKPGLTGLAQVYANYSTSAQNKLRYDLMYISHYSLLLDLQILAQTAAVLVTPQRAQGVEKPNQVSEELLRDLRGAWDRLAPARDRGRTG
jgi:lipopolysaccharide/colanic/teichoic acid biosynthesis glycosyltransferase